MSDEWVDMWWRSVKKAEVRHGDLSDGVRREPLAFVAEAKQELLRLIVDVQQNRNRPEDLP